MQDVAVAAKSSVSEELSTVKKHYEDAVESRKKAEGDIEAFRPEIEELMKQICNMTASCNLPFSIPDFAAALRDIQTEYEEIAAKNLQEMDEWYKSKFVDFNQASTKHAEKT